MIIKIDSGSNQLIDGRKMDQELKMKTLEVYKRRTRMRI